MANLEFEIAAVPAYNPAKSGIEGKKDHKPPWLGAVATSTLRAHSPHPDTSGLLLTKLICRDDY